ncbi:hypothetical protein K4F52_007323 [Lecanicillium sp. MT-2017a]|nr:hypothetical protein K4F52_007323 [Lecanicillium sp. MT-2017a]
MLSIEETRALSQVHPEFAPILAEGGPMVGGWTLDTDIHAIRDVIAQMRATQFRVDPASRPHTEEDVKIPARDGTAIRARIYKPRSAPGDGCPGMVAYHGGGFVVGDFETERWLCEMFTQMGGIAVNVDYRMAPEHVFPAAVEDSLDAAKWTAQNAASLGINPKKGLLVAGESAGADLALVVSHLYRDTNISPPLTGVYAAIPSAVNDETIPAKYKDRFISMTQNADSPIVSRESLKLIHKLYKPDPTSPLAYPLASPTHSGLPKTYFQACGLDVLRDCALVLEQAYRDSGVPTKIDVYPGLPHGFWAVYSDLKVTQQHTEDTREALKWLLAE